MDLAPYVEAAGKLGVAITMGAALWYFILYPRKTHEGRPKSSLLVPGWIHDDTLAEVERVRKFYERVLKDAQEASDARIQEWRGFRDEERAKRIDAENDRKALLAAVNGLGQDVALLLEIQGAKDGRRPRSQPKEAAERGGS